MHLVPKDKFDMQACKRLEKASDEEVIYHLDDLLGWTADVNWPVASHVIDRVKVLGDELVVPLKNILSSADDTWKYFIIVHLIPGLREDVFSQLKNDLGRIVSNPTDSEVLEEVYLETKDLLTRRKTV